jgi:hypothetical protein
VGAVAALPGAVEALAAPAAVAAPLPAGADPAGAVAAAPAAAAAGTPVAPPATVPPPIAAPVDQLRAAADASAAGLTVVAATAEVAGTGPAPLPTVTGAQDVVVPAPSTVLSVGTDAAGAEGSGTDSGPGTPAPSTPDAGPAPADDLPTGIPGSAPLTPAATPAAAAAPAARETPVAAQLAPQLAVLRNAPDGSQTMTVVLTPDSLGEVTVQVTITDGTLDLMLRGGSEHGRHALADALPELRRELEGAGLSFSRLAVDPDAPRDGGSGGRTAEQLMADLRGNGSQQQQGSTPHRAPAWAGSDTSPGEGPAPALRPSASSGVDVRV